MASRREDVLALIVSAPTAMLASVRLYASLYYEDRLVVETLQGGLVGTVKASAVLSNAG